MHICVACTLTTGAFAIMWRKKKICFHRICGIASYKPANPAYVELRVFRFYFFDEAYTAPPPNIIRHPV